MRSINIFNAMTPMYEVIMNLPLFKGVGSSQISSFLEKTPISFSQYEPGEVILKEGTVLDTLKFLIGGKISVSYTIGGTIQDTNGGLNSIDILKIIETIESPAVLGAEKLFGMHRTIDSDIVCTQKASIMELTKEQYLRLLQTDQIYLINYLNYLSIRAQSGHNMFIPSPRLSFNEILLLLIENYVSRNATTIFFEFDYNIFAEYCNLSLEALIKKLALLEKEGVIKQTKEGFRISSRKNFADHLVGI